MYLSPDLQTKRDASHALRTRVVFNHPLDWQSATGQQRQVNFDWFDCNLAAESLNSKLSIK